MENLKTLYLIDDDTDDLEFFCEAVNSVDSSIICFKTADSENALRAFQQHEVPLPDMIFLDLNMPLVDGRMFLAEIKKINAYANIPVIIYSTSRHSKDMDDTMKLGAAGFMTKPHSQEVLVNQLQTILSEYSYRLSQPEEMSMKQ
jgi:CheY-like chemotaxis protein